MDISLGAVGADPVGESALLPTGGALSAAFGVDPSDAAAALLGSLGLGSISDSTA